MPLTTLDAPVTGHGYNSLQFVFDLVNYANSVKMPEGRGKENGKLQTDADGSITVEYLKNVCKRVERITGDTPRPLGLHSIIYFYIRSGTFQPTVFIAASDFLRIWLIETNYQVSVKAVKHLRIF